MNYDKLSTKIYIIEHAGTTLACQLFTQVQTRPCRTSL